MGVAVGLDPWEIGRYTPTELTHKVEKYYEELRRGEALGWVQGAWMISYLLQPHLKKNVKLRIEDLVSDEALVLVGMKDAPSEPPPPEDRSRMFKEIAERFEESDG